MEAKQTSPIRASTSENGPTTPLQSPKESDGCPDFSFIHDVVGRLPGILRAKICPAWRRPKQRQLQLSENSWPTISSTQRAFRWRSWLSSTKTGKNL